MTQTLTELVEREAAKRERNWDPKLRWKVLQETITWVESQATVRRNTPAACLANQQRLLAQFAQYRANELTVPDGG
jgi:hypothetical protein